MNAFCNFYEYTKYFLYTRHILRATIVCNRRCYSQCFCSLRPFLFPSTCVTGKTLNVPEHLVVTSVITVSTCTVNLKSAHMTRLRRLPPQQNNPNFDKLPPLTPKGIIVAYTTGKLDIRPYHRTEARAYSRTRRFSTCLCVHVTSSFEGVSKISIMLALPLGEVIAHKQAVWRATP